MPKTKTIQRQSIGQLRALVASRKQGFVASKREQNNLSEIAKLNGTPVATVKNIKANGYDVMPRLISSCHKAPVLLGGNGTTHYPHYYICHRCNKACDTV